MPGYDNIAKGYDFLSRVIFGKSLVHAQVFLLKFIPANSNILIVGGGTGWVLDELSLLHPNGLKIDYVEVSEAMLSLSKKRNCQQNTVRFISADIEKFQGENQYDVILTPFLFDNFKEEKIVLVFDKLATQLAANGLWLFADFYINKKERLWQKALLKAMYIFFKIFCNIEAGNLINMKAYFHKNYSLVAEKYFYKSFIKSIVYKKNGEVL